MTDPLSKLPTIFWIDAGMHTSHSPLTAAALLRVVPHSSKNNNNKVAKSKTMADNNIFNDLSDNEDANDGNLLAGIRRDNVGVFEDDLSPALQRQRLEDDDDDGNRNDNVNIQVQDDNGGGDNNDGNDVIVNGNRNAPRRRNIHGFVNARQQLLVSPKHQLRSSNPLEHLTVMAGAQAIINSIDQLTGHDTSDDDSDFEDDDNQLRVVPLSRVCTLGANYGGQSSTAMIGVVTSIKIVNTVSYQQYSRSANNGGGRRGGTTTQSNQRVYHIADPLSESGQNICAVFENRRGERLPSNDQTNRDHCGICKYKDSLIYLIYLVM